MPKIEFIYEQSCPNVADARAQLRLALEQTGLPARWQEWEHNDPNSPAYARGYGSPSILVDGKDVADEPISDAVQRSAGITAPSCRVYTNTQGRNRGVPDAALIRTALENCRQNSQSSLPAGRIQLAVLAAGGGCSTPSQADLPGLLASVRRIAQRARRRLHRLHALSAAAHTGFSGRDACDPCVAAASRLCTACPRPVRIRVHAHREIFLRFRHRHLHRCGAAGWRISLECLADTAQGSLCELQTRQRGLIECPAHDTRWANSGYRLVVQILWMIGRREAEPALVHEHQGTAHRTRSTGSTRRT